MKMMGFDYEIVYRNGVSNVVADSLSKLPLLEFHTISAFQTDVMSKIKHNWMQVCKL